MKKFISLCKKHTSIVFVLLTMNAVAFTQPVSSSDSLALVALYNSTNGPGWTNSTNWLTGPVSTWYGVNVMNNRVWIIDLHDNNLTGNIPYEIGNISNLQYLYLFNNHLTGTIPNTIGNLSNLVNLILSGNHLTSNIPSEIGNLISLQELNIAGNQLNGSIPHEIGNLLNLRSISLMGNQITGSLPAEMGNLINLTTINLSINQLTDSIPSRIGNLSNLDVLMLNNNQLSGNIPNTIWHMANLETLYLQENQLNGELTSEIGSSSKLAVLRLENNRLTGSIPVEIGNLLNLKALMLSSNQFTGTIPDVIWDLTSLSNLSLNDNQLCGTLPADIGNMINLRTLTLGDNQLSGNIPEELSNLSLLELLYISNCSFDGLPALNNINNLNVLNAENNKLSFEDIEPNIGVANTFTYSPQDMVGEEQNIALSAGDHYTMSVTVGGTHNHYQWYKNSSIIPGASSSSYTISSASSADAGTYECRITNSVATELTLYSRSIHISVQNTGLTIDSLALVALYNSTNGPSWTNRTNWLSGPVSTWYGIGTGSGRVTSVNLSDNNLSGTIPTEIGMLPHLQILALNNNHLTGNIPPQIGELTNLHHFYLDGNNINGCIPAEMGNLKKLLVLGMDNNRLSGSIPTALGNMTMIAELSLRGNQLSGSIPSSIGNLSNLTWLNLSSNQLTGSIPAEMGNLPSIMYLYLNNNYLTGYLPKEIGNLTNLIVLFLSDNQLYGSIPPEFGNLSNLNTVNMDNNQFWGSVPAEISRLSNVVSFSLINNNLENLPVLSGLPKLNILHVESNQLTFEDIEPNVAFPMGAFVYSPQDSVGTEQKVTLYKDDYFQISAQVGGTHNQYQWYKNGTYIPGANASGYVIASASPVDAGAYTCHITNTIATDLTLYSRPVTIIVIPNSPPEVSDIPDQTIEQGGTFATINLDNYVADAETNDEDITWTYWGNTQLGVSIVNHIATISTPYKNWYGTDTVVFSAHDGDPSYPLSAWDKATFKVTPLRAPVLGSVTQPTCNIATGSVVLTCLPASGTWTLTRNPGGITKSGTGTCITVSGLASGTYSFTVSNVYGGTSPASDNLVINTQPSIPAAPIPGTITHPNCTTATGSVILNGLPSSGTWTLTRTPGSNSYTGTGTNTLVSGLATGKYTFTVTSAAGCTSSESDNVIINAQPATPSAPMQGAITQPTCTSATGSVVLNGLPSSGSWTLTRNPGGITSSGTGTNTTVSGLSAGTYTFSVTNAAGCTSVLSGNVIINAQPSTPSAPIPGAVTHPSCTSVTGSVVLSGLPSTGTWTLTRNPGGINTAGTGTGITASGLAAGTYTFTVTNESGCTSVASSDVVINTGPSIPSAPVPGTINHPTCSSANGSIMLNELPSSGTWTLTNAQGGSTSGNGTNVTLTGLTTGIYLYTVTNESGCASAKSDSIVLNDVPVISAQQLITVDEDASITITAAQFVICDTDDDLTKMTVNLGSGSNYNVSFGNTIIPVADFNGTLNVPVTVHDGSNSSASFEASVTVIPVNDRPVIKPIPDQEIKKDSAFSDIYLDEYITDNETSCELITWTYAGNNELTVKITDRVASITVADADWTGSDTVVFCATDNDMVDPLSAKDTVVFKVLDITGTGPVTLESLDILIYPNPAKEQVNVIFKQAGINEAYIKIEIISIQGEVVYILKHSTKDKVVVLDVYDLKPGVYFMRFIASGDPVKTEKLVIHP